MAKSLREQLAVHGSLDLSEFDSRDDSAFDGDKDDSVDHMEALEETLSDLQEKLFAHGRTDSGPERVLLVLQGMDTAGKGGVIRHAAGLVDPQGLTITSFKKPTPEELEHDFLWRIEKALPEPGMIGIFDRSHYEDVLIGRVRRLADDAEIERRYGAINDFEKAFVDSGGVLLKCFLHISADDQRERLQARLDDPTKHWKYNPGDIDERELWDDYQEAYRIAIERCSTDHAPWHLVPSGRKWFRNWAVAQMLAETLEGLDLDWPTADYNVDHEIERLAAS